MHYRLYALHDVTGKIVNGGDIIADSDAEALRAGQTAYPGIPFEIWCGERRVFTSRTDVHQAA